MNKPEMIQPKYRSSVISKYRSPDFCVKCRRTSVINTKARYILFKINNLAFNLYNVHIYIYKLLKIIPCKICLSFISFDVSVRVNPICIEDCISVVCYCILFETSPCYSSFTTQIFFIKMADLKINQLCILIKIYEI